jgi:hypothetical protein
VLEPVCEPQVSVAVLEQPFDLVPSLVALVVEPWKEVVDVLKAEWATL